jgi:hypothetical protein
LAVVREFKATVERGESVCRQLIMGSGKTVRSAATAACIQHGDIDDDGYADGDDDDGDPNSPPTP